MALLDTPRNRRLRTDADALAQLKDQSSIFSHQAFGEPPERFLITFRGKGLMRKSETEPVEVANVHRAEIRLGIDYPRSRPDIQWLTQIYHPNISAVGAVCLGGYSTNWVPSLSLDELCTMLWDMIRFANYDPKSAYNYAAGRWCETQEEWQFPLDVRPIRDKVGQTVGDNIIKLDLTAEDEAAPPKEVPPKEVPTAVEAPPIVQPEEEDILIIDDNTTTPPPAAPPPSQSTTEDDILIIE